MNRVLGIIGVVALVAVGIYLYDENRHNDVIDDVGDAVEDVADDVGDAAEDVADDIEDATDDKPGDSI